MLERGQAKTRANSNAKITEVQSDAENEDNGPRESHNYNNKDLKI